MAVRPAPGDNRRGTEYMPTRNHRPLETFESQGKLAIFLYI
jgi:hypothetical protein